MDRYRRWFEFEQDAHDKTMRSLEGAPATAQSAPDYQKCVDLMAHVVAARWTWLYRLGGVGQPPAEIFPQRVGLAQLKVDLGRMHAVWSAFLTGLSDTDLGRVFEYTRVDGNRYSNTVEDTLTQLYGHSLYHRGQIAMLLRRMGAEPAATDFIFWARQPLSERVAG